MIFREEEGWSISAPQGNGGGSITRKDYVDDKTRTANLTGSVHGLPDGSDVLEYFRTNPTVTVRSMGSVLANGPAGWSYGVFQFYVHEIAGDGTLNHGYLFAYDVGSGVTHRNIFNTGSGWQGWARLYDTQNRPTAAEGNSDIVAGGYGQVGTYAMLTPAMNFGDVNVGYVRAGIDLHYSSATGWSSTPADGTWKLLGSVEGDHWADADSTSVWIRIA